MNERTNYNLALQTASNTVRESNNWTASVPFLLDDIPQEENTHNGTHVLNGQYETIREGTLFSGPMQTLR